MRKFKGLKEELKIISERIEDDMLAFTIQLYYI